LLLVVDVAVVEQSSVLAPLPHVALEWAAEDTLRKTSAAVSQLLVAALSCLVDQVVFQEV
jgi:hypothetical protein